MEIKRLKEFIQTKNMEINQLSGKNRNLIQEIDQLHISINSSKNNSKSDSGLMQQMQERFVLMGQQIQRLNLRIK